MIILGIDPGYESAPTGAAIIQLAANTVTLLESYRLHSTARGWQARQYDILAQLHALFTPAIGLVCYELAWLGKNAQTALRMESLGGGVRGLAVAARVPCIGVSPAQSKAALVGVSNATKQQMIDAARALTGQAMSEHEADALGHALAGEAAWRREQVVMEAGR